MKTILFAATAAFTFVTPAMAQPAQPAAGHQGHDMSAHQGHASAQHQGHAADHAQHQAGQADDCCADRNGNGKMDCCEHMETAEARDCCADHAQHQQQGQSAAPARPNN